MGSWRMASAPLPARALRSCRTPCRRAVQVATRRVKQASKADIFAASCAAVHFIPSCRTPCPRAVQVATRRVKQANKAEIPLLDDHVSKIEHIGRETVKKLADMKTAAAEIGMTLRLADNVRRTRGRKFV